MDFATVFWNIKDSVESMYARLPRIKRFQILLWIAAIFVLVYLEQDLSFLPAVEDADVQFKNQTHTKPKPTPLPSQSPTPLPSLPPTPTPVTMVDSAPFVRRPTTFSTASENEPMITFPPQPPIAASEFTLQIPKQATTPFETLPQSVQDYVSQHCDLSSPLKGWYPNVGLEKTAGSISGDNSTSTAVSTSSNSWQLRIPYVILAGVWNCGVHTLGTALQNHPQVNYKAATQDFFLPRQFYKFQTGQISVEKDTRKVKVFAARQRLYAQVYPQNQQYPKFPTSIALDISPGYLYYAQQTSLSIQCVAPWAKTVILLRHPVERIYHQWVYGRQNLGLRISLEEWMAQDIKAMQSVGLIPGGGAAATSEGLSEREAWKQYQAVRNLVGVLGRSLYVLQLEEWFETLKQMGKNPTEEVHLIRSELWDKQPFVEYAKVVDFLGLVPHYPKDLQPMKESFVQHQSQLPPMNEETQKMLENFFAPYNARLAKLLDNHGFNHEGDWNAPLWNAS